MMKILVVEDERLLADSLQTLLTGRGFSVDTANDGLTGLEYAKTDVYDLVILDVMMPGLDGYTVASRLRAEHHAVPILMLTAKSDLMDRVAGLNAGADYYLTKPFDSRELLACVGALLRRQGEQVDELTFGNTALDLSAGMLRCGSKSVRLSAREFDVMRILLQAKGGNVSSASGALTPTPWRIMWRSTPASCGKSSRALARTSASRPSGGWAIIWRWRRYDPEAPRQARVHPHGPADRDAGRHVRPCAAFYAAEP